jgi:hypothetical protein
MGPGKNEYAKGHQTAGYGAFQSYTENDFIQI